MDKFGDQLRCERERRDVALDEISRATKIRVRYLQALEDGDHGRLPGIVFAKGYIRAYAETIGADPDPLVRAYVEEQRSLGRLETEASAEQVLSALAAAVEQDHSARSKRIRTAFVLVTVLLLIGASLGFAIVHFRNADNPRLKTAAAAVPLDVAKPDSAPGSDEPASPELTPEAAIVETTTPELNTESIATPLASLLEPTVAKTAIAVVNQNATLSIPEFGVGTNVVKRSLIGRDTTFAAQTQIVFWTRVLGGAPGRSIRHVWMREGDEIGSVNLSISAEHWRTFSRQTLRQAGNWSVEARDERGRVLARETFVATDGHAPATP